MPTDHDNQVGRFAGLTASEVLAEQERLLELWKQEDADRSARRLAIMESWTQHDA